MGGLTWLSTKDEAETWVGNKLWYLYGPQPTETFSKGDFRGLLFVKFTTTGDRDAAVRVLKNVGDKIWAKKDEEVEIRVIKGLVFGTKELFVT